MFDLKAVLTIISGLLVAMGIGGEWLYRTGKNNQKNKQIAKDLHAADDAKKRLEDSRNQPIDDKLDSLHEHG